MSYDYDYWYRDRDWKQTNEAYKRKRSKPGKHVPNKLEAKVLRKLMSETGLTETELREIPKHRKELSEAQKPKLSLKPYNARIVKDPRWNGSKPSENKFIVGLVVRKKGTPITECDEFATTQTWIIKGSRYTQKPINDSMYMEYWELSLENFLEPWNNKDKEDSRNYEIIPFEKVEKWKLKLMSKKFGL